MIKTIEKPVELERKVESGCDIPPIFGRCPVCKHELRPHDKITGLLKPPTTDDTKYSRAICISCNTVLQYLGSGCWSVYKGE